MCHIHREGDISTNEWMYRINKKLSTKSEKMFSICHVTKTAIDKTVFVFCFEKKNVGKFTYIVLVCVQTTKNSVA